MRLCNYCKKEIKKGKDVNLEWDIWRNEKDGDNVENGFFIEEIHLECAKKIITKLEEELKKQQEKK